MSFTTTDEGTEVRLVHSGWQESADGVEIRSSYDSDTGWTSVLARFTDATAGVSA